MRAGFRGRPRAFIGFLAPLPSRRLRRIDSGLSTGGRGGSVVPFNLRPVLVPGGGAEAVDDSPIGYS